jgi:phosphate transport system protein
VADHATTIAEDVIFWVEGDDVRHHKSLAAQKDGKSASPGALGD